MSFRSIEIQVAGFFSQSIFIILTPSGIVNSITPSMLYVSNINWIRRWMICETVFKSKKKMKVEWILLVVWQCHLCHPLHTTITKTSNEHWYSKNTLKKIWSKRFSETSWRIEVPDYRVCLVLLWYLPFPRLKHIYVIRCRNW